MGQILNSKGEFSRCYIPRLVIEEEDQEAKEERLSMEKQERDLVTKLMDEDDDEWEKRKQRDRELRDKKRGRGNCNEEDETPILDQGKKRRVKRLKFDVLREDWGQNEEGGEHDDQPEPVLPPPPVIRRRGAELEIVVELGNLVPRKNFVPQKVFLPLRYFQSWTAKSF